ncbi:MAG: DUF4329 domain-containing protein [Erythrobacter sp.]
MRSASSIKLVLAVCFLAWAVIVVRAYVNSKGPEAFVVTATTDEVREFAKAQLAELQQRSFAEDVELCGIIFEESDGSLGSSAIITGSLASCDIAYFDEPGMAPIASFHTHGAFNKEYDSEVPSLLDIESDISSRMDGYVSTPGGRFWRVDWLERTTNQVCGPGCLAQDPNFVACQGDIPAIEYTIVGLRERSTKEASPC